MKREFILFKRQMDRLPFSKQGFYSKMQDIFNALKVLEVKECFYMEIVVCVVFYMVLMIHGIIQMI